MDSRPLGTLLVIVGAMAVLIGILIGTGLLNWFGRLPGDIRFERDNVRIYIPLVSMLLVSAGLTLVTWIARKLM